MHSGLLWAIQVQEFTELKWIRNLRVQKFWKTQEIYHDNLETGKIIPRILKHAKIITRETVKKQSEV